MATDYESSHMVLFWALWGFAVLRGPLLRIFLSHMEDFTPKQEEKKKKKAALGTKSWDDEGICCWQRGKDGGMSS